jgi:hypothetical protein
MMKFATFEKTVEYIYKYLNAPKESYTAFQQTGISFLGGYIAGIGSAIVSHPADVMVSKLNSDRKGISTSFATAPEPREGRKTCMANTPFGQPERAR